MCTGCDAIHESVHQYGFEDYGTEVKCGICGQCWTLDTFRDEDPASEDTLGFIKWPFEGEGNV